MTQSKFCPRCLPFDENPLRIKLLIPVTEPDGRYPYYSGMTDIVVTCVTCGFVRIVPDGEYTLLEIYINDNVPLGNLP